MTIVKGKSCNEPQIVEEIRNIIPEANIQNSISAQMVILLPNENIDKFPELFKMLEMNSKKFCINGMGVSCTTMEEVFLKYLFFYYKTFKIIHNNIIDMLWSNIIIKYKNF